VDCFAALAMTGAFCKRWDVVRGLLRCARNDGWHLAMTVAFGNVL